MGYEIGNRVGAIFSAHGDTIEIFGFGLFKGDTVPPKVSLGFGPMLHTSNIDNPQILLDSGETVWGCECWWGSEDKIKQKIANYKNVITITVQEARQRQ